MRIDVKRLTPTAKLPTIAYEGDLGYDLYADKDCLLQYGRTAAVSTGIAIELYDPWVEKFGKTIQRFKRYGAILKDRSSLASQGIMICGGVVDAGYRGPIIAHLTYFGSSYYSIKCGDKIAQMIPILAQPHAGVYEVDELTESERGEKRQGSSGR